MTPILSFLPDADQSTPGILSDCENMVPYLGGMRGANTPVSIPGVPVIPAVCQGAAVTSKLDGSRRILAGTTTALYELVSGSWSNVSRGVAYTGGADTRWSFAQFGDATIAANRADKIQRSTAGAFADIASAPKAEIVFSVGSQVMALNTDDGAVKLDGWHCCALFDDTSWAPSVTTQAASGRLVASPGAITAGAKLGEYAVAYKKNAIFLGQYVGAPAVWDWTQVIGGSAGCVGKDALCDVNGTHFFVGEDNFWLFNGTQPTPIGDGTVRFWFIENSNPTLLYKTQCRFDSRENLIWIFYCGKNSQVIDSALVYHVLSKKWGKVSQSIESVIDYYSPSLTIDGMGAISSTIDGLPTAGFDSPFWNSGARAFSIIDTNHTIKSLSGSTATCSFTSGDTGDDWSVLLLQQIRLRYDFAPSSALVSTYFRMNSGLSYSAGPSGSINDGKFDALKSARWHKVKVTFTGNVKVTHIDASYKKVGSR